MRKQKKYHFIYKTTNNKNGKYYIGMHSTDNIEDDYLGSGKQLWNSIKYHGKENFTREILEFCDSRNELKIREEQIVNLQEISKGKCMNLRIGGQGGFIDINHMMKCTKAGGTATCNIINERKKIDTEFRNCCITQSKNAIISYYKTHEGSFKNKYHTEKTKKKMSESKKGKGIGIDNSQFGTRWITNERINKKIKINDNLPNEFRFGRI